MKTHIEKATESKQAITASSSARSESHQTTFQFEDNRSEALAQRKLQKEVTQYVHQKAPVQFKKNNTGLPDPLKTGIEHLSGLAMDDVKVHYNSAKPAQLQAHAYAQGTAIHIAPGQEKHLPHEAWHVVQQKQGRVKPTLQLKGKINVNDNEGLEREADVMGAQSLAHIYTAKTLFKNSPAQNKVIQRQFIDVDPENEAQLTAFQEKKEELDTLPQKEVFDKLFNDPIISISMNDAFERAQHINFIKQLDPSNVNAKSKLTPENIAYLQRIANPKQFIGLYAILTGQDNLNWPKAYREADDELQLHFAGVEEDRQQLALEQENDGAANLETMAEEAEIQRSAQQLIAVRTNLTEGYGQALRETGVLLEKIKGNRLFEATDNEHAIREITIHIHAIITRLRGMESRSHSAKARAHAVEGVEEDHQAGSAIYHHIAINDHSITKNFRPVDTSLKQPAAKSVIKLNDKNVKTAKVIAASGQDFKAAKEKVIKSFEGLPKAQNKTQVYRGPARYADRGPGQANSMRGINAATYAWAIGLNNALATDWEWLHIQGAGLGGQTDSTNLLPGLYDANTLMIPFESNIKILARYATNFMPLTVNFLVVGPRAGEHAAQSIQINWQFNHVTFPQRGSAQFDILNGRVVTKGDIEVIEEFLKTERTELIDTSATKKSGHSQASGSGGQGASKKARSAAQDGPRAAAVADEEPPSLARKGKIQENVESL
jgi:hypothetical protein